MCRRFEGSPSLNSEDDGQDMEERKSQDDLSKKYLDQFTFNTILKEVTEREKKMCTTPVLTKVTKGWWDDFSLAIYVTLTFLPSAADLDI